MKNRYANRRTLKAHRKLPLVKVEAHLPEDLHDFLLKKSMSLGIELDILLTTILLRLHRENTLSTYAYLFPLPKKMIHVEGLTKAPSEIEDILFGYILPCIETGVNIYDLIHICLDKNLTLTDISTGIHGLMEKKLISLENNVAKAIYFKRPRPEDRFTKVKNVKVRKPRKKKLVTQPIIKKLRREL